MSSSNHPRSSARRQIGLDGRPVNTTSRPKFFGGITRRSKRFAIAIAAPALFAAAIAGATTTANASAPMIQAGANCDGTVSFTAKAGNDSNATTESRTNTNVEIQYSINGVDGPFETVKSTGATYAFNEANGFAFSDKFALPSNLKRPTTLTVQAVAVAKWGSKADLDVANQTSKTSIRVEDCGQVAPPTAKISTPTCVAEYSKAELTNPSTEPVEFQFFRDDSATPFDTQTVKTGTTTHEIVLDKDATVSIRAPKMKTVTQIVKAPKNCAEDVRPQEPTTGVVRAAISKQCDANGSGFSVVLDNSANAVEREFEVVVGDREIGRLVVPAAESTTARYLFVDVAIPLGATKTVLIRSDEQVLATTEMANDCVASAAGIALACDTSAGSGVVLSFQNTGRMADTFTVVRDGSVVAGTPFTLEPSTMATQKLLRLNNNESANISITSTSGLQLTKDVTLRCEGVPGQEKPVQAQPISRHGLADTGYDFMPLLIVGGSLLVLGIGALGVRRFVRD